MTFNLTLLPTWLNESLGNSSTGHENTSTTATVAMATTTTLSPFLQSLDELDARLLDNRLSYFDFYGVILPLMASLGALGNIACFLVFHHPEMRCLSSLLLSAVLISDTAYLVCMTLLFSPRSWIAYMNYGDNNPAFWFHLEATQYIFLWVYPLAEMAQCLVVWYTMALAIEKYLVLFHPQSIWAYSTRDKGLKIITTIFIPTILVHMVHWFKFVRHDAYFVHLQETHTKICLSDIYRSKHFQTYEKFLYYVVFRVIPWVVVIILLPKTIVGGFKARLKVNNRISDLQLSRTFKSGRSSRIVILNLLLFVICDAVSLVMYACAVRTMEFDQYLSKCRLTPSSRRFDKLPSHMEFLYEFFLLFYSSVKFPLCFLSSYEIRRLICQCCCWPRTNSDRIKEIAVYILSDNKDY